MLNYVAGPWKIKHWKDQSHDMYEVAVPLVGTLSANILPEVTKKHQHNFDKAIIDNLRLIAQAPELYQVVHLLRENKANQAKVLAENILSILDDDSCPDIPKEEIRKQLDEAGKENISITMSSTDMFHGDEEKAVKFEKICAEMVSPGISLYPNEPYESTAAYIPVSVFPDEMVERIFADAAAKSMAQNARNN